MFVLVSPHHHRFKKLTTKTDERGLNGNAGLLAKAMRKVAEERGVFPEDEKEDAETRKKDSAETTRKG